MAVQVEVARRTGTWPLIVNSILASTLGIVIAVLVDSLGRVILGLLLDRGPVLFHDRTAFTAGDNSLALAGGALAALLAGLLFLALYPGSRRHDASRLAVLWLILHSFRQGFVPLALTPVSSDSDFAQAVTSLGLPSGINVVVGAAGAVGLLLVSLAAAPAFLAFAPTAKEIDTAARRVAYVARIAVLPGVGGALLAVAFFLPDSGNGLIPALPLFGLFTLATLLAAPGTRSAAPDQLATAQRISWGLAATVVITFVILRFALARGIPIPPNPDSFFLP